VKEVDEGKKVLSTVPALVALIVRPGAIPPVPKLKNGAQKIKKQVVGLKIKKWAKVPGSKLKMSREV